MTAIKIKDIAHAFKRNFFLKIKNIPIKEGIPKLINHSNSEETIITISFSTTKLRITNPEVSRIKSFLKTKLGIKVLTRQVKNTPANSNNEKGSPKAININRN